MMTTNFYKYEKSNFELLFMKSFVKLFLILFLILLYGLTVNAKDIVVKGTTVNEKGNPVSNAYVFYFTQTSGECEDCWEEINYYTVSNDNGNFSIYLDESKRGESIMIFPVKGEIEKYDSPLLPPFAELSLTDSKYKGIKIQLGSSSLIDIRDVQIKLYLEVIKVKLSNNLFRVPLNKKSLWIRIRDKNGNTLVTPSLPSKAFLPDESSVIFLLPKDIWSIDFSSSQKPWETIGHININLHNNINCEFEIQ